MHSWLWDWIPWGYAVLLRVEMWHSHGLNVFFNSITTIGGELGLLLLLSLTYWSFSKPVGRGLSYAYLTAVVFNTWLKALWQVPRPDDPQIEPLLQKVGITSHLHPLAHEASPSFPSGHAQGATVGWGYVAAAARRRWLSWSIAILVLLIALSRMYVGVHYPQDVIGGLILGGLNLLAWLWGESYARPYLTRLTLTWRYVLAVFAPLTLFLVHPTDATASPLGTLIGAGIGYILEGETLRFTEAQTWGNRLWRGVVGLALLLTLFFGLHALTVPLTVYANTPLEIGLRLLRYLGIGFSAAWIVPWMLIRLQLAESSPK